MTAHEEARMRAAPLVARIMRNIAADRGCEPEALKQTLHDAVEASVLVELETLLDPWAGDRHTPLVPERQSERIDEDNRVDEPITVNQRVPSVKRTKKVTPR